MDHRRFFYIDGQWTPPVVSASLDVIDPATEQPFTQIAVGSPADVDKAVGAAKRAFADFSRTSRERRLALLESLLAAYNARGEDLARAVSQEMGAPLAFAREAQVWAGRVHLEATIRALRGYEFSRRRGGSLIVEEPIGVCALITPWNWPLNQIVCKVAPGARRRLHGRAEAERDRADQRHHLRRDHGRGRHARRRLQSRQRRRAERRAGDGRPSRRRHGLVHRIDARRDHRRQGGGRYGQARRAGTRRQVAQHHAARRAISRPR